LTYQLLVIHKTFSISAQETSPHGIAFNNNGTKMFIVGKTGDDVNEYALSTGFDVSSASYSQNFSIAAQETDPTGIAFNADGTKMFIVGHTGDSVYEYYLTPSLELGTGSFASSDIGKTVEANSGKFVLTNTDGRCAETTQANFLRSSSLWRLGNVRCHIQSCRW
jgi:DNA-binding beta-propeller fold protein YncE